MSRGPGRWQRAILDELNYRRPYVVVDDLLRELVGEHPTRAQKVAFRRAAEWLVNDDVLEVACVCRGCGVVIGNVYEAAEHCAAGPRPPWQNELDYRRWWDSNRPQRVLRFPR